MNDGVILTADALSALRGLEAETVDMCLTSPPYYNLRDYGAEGQIGLEDTPEHYIDRLVEVFRELRRVLKPEGTLWLNISDSYAWSLKGRNMDGSHAEGGIQAGNKGSTMGKVGPTIAPGCKKKDLIGIPWLLALALRADGWYLRQDIIWVKPNAMPESVKDRFTKSHEYIFLLSKSERYYFDADAVKERRVGMDDRPVAGSIGALGPQQTRRRSGNVERKERPTPGGGLKGNIPYDGTSEYRNRRDVWNVATRGGKGEHFATFPEELANTCILAGSPMGGTVIDPFLGSGTTAVTAQKLGRRYIGIEINPSFAKLAERRVSTEAAQIGLEALVCER